MRKRVIHHQELVKEEEDMAIIKTKRGLTSLKLNAIVVINRLVYFFVNEDEAWTLLLTPIEEEGILLVHGTLALWKKSHVWTQGEWKYISFGDSSKVKIEGQRSHFEYVWMEQFLKVP